MLPPGGHIGILGAGQLGRMLAQAATSMGFYVHSFAPEADAPAADISHRFICAAYDDMPALADFIAQTDCVTYEFENIPLATADYIEQNHKLFPSATALRLTGDRIDEKTFINGLGIATAPFHAVTSKDDMQNGLAALGGAGIVKTCRFGYDGKGQWRLESPQDIDSVFTALAGRPALIEAIIPFDKEISVIAARGYDGQFVCYDVGENIHKNHILARSIIPAQISPSLAGRAQHIAAHIAQGLDYVGVLGIEFFVIGDEIIVNEIAPRVHNSGHWTKAACAISQFAQHIRAIAGWPLGACTRHSDAVMTNLIGDDVKRWQDWAHKPNCALELYGKKDIRPGRKMGHVTEMSPRT